MHDILEYPQKTGSISDERVFFFLSKTTEHRIL